MPRLIHVPRWRCDYCSYTHEHIKDLLWHQSNLCCHNPARRTCLTCRYWHAEDAPLKRCGPHSPTIFASCDRWQPVLKGETDEE